MKTFYLLTVLALGVFTTSTFAAETAVERRMYRALAALVAMRTGPIGNLLP